MITAADVVKGATIWVQSPSYKAGHVHKTTIKSGYGSDEVITSDRVRVPFRDAWLTASDALLALGIRAQKRAKAARQLAETEDQLAAKLIELAREA